MREQSRTLVIGSILAAFAVAATLFVPAAGAGDNDAARKLLEKSVDAIGGKKACESWTTLMAKGDLTVHWEGWGTPKADATLWVKRPDKMVLDQDFSANDHPFFFTYYYYAGDVWAVVNLGVRQHPRYTKMMTRALKNNQSVYYFLTKCDTMWVVNDVPDDSLLAGSTVDRVGIVDVGDTLMVDLDKKTHLPVRQIENGGAQQTLFEAWHEAHGKLKRPYKVTIYQNGAVSAEYDWKEFDFDIPLDDGLFEKN
ncbi:MAG: hypothetical protein PVF33_12695, partial [Candidatus Latescibacterota bacterium]